MSSTILLDTNIYDCLQADAGSRGILVRLVEDGHAEVVVTPKIRDELEAGPFCGVPDWFPMSDVVESVAVLDHWRLGEAALGEGVVFTAHRGESRKVADAIVADSADTYVDIVVSEDKRLRTRLSKLTKTCIVLNFIEFGTWLQGRA